MNVDQSASAYWRNAATDWRNAATWGCATLLFLVLPIAVTIAFVIGGIVGQSQLYHDRAEVQARQMQSFLSNHSNRYVEVKIREASDGWSYMHGFVRSQADYDFLQLEMKRLFGEELGNRMVENVEVLVPPPSGR